MSKTSYGYSYCTSPYLSLGGVTTPPFLFYHNFGIILCSMRTLERYILTGVGAMSMTTFKNDGHKVVKDYVVELLTNADLRNKVLQENLPAADSYYIFDGIAFDDIKDKRVGNLSNDEIACLCNYVENGIVGENVTIGSIQKMVAA